MSYLFGGGSSLPALSDNGTNVISTEPITVPDSAGSGAPSVKGATAASGLFLNGTVPGIVSGTANWLSVVGATAAGGVQVPAAGAYGIGSGTTIGAGGSDVFLTRKGAGNWRLGAADLNGSPVAQTISVQNAITGTDLPGVATTTFTSSLGTGLGAPSKFIFQTPLLGVTGTTAQTAAIREALGHSKTGLTNNTATAVAQLALPSNSMASAQFAYTVEVSDGTDFQTETGMVSFASVNKAAALTHGTPVKSGNVQALSSAATLVVTFTAVTNGSAVDLKITSNSSLTPTTNRVHLSVLNLSFANNITLN